MVYQNAIAQPREELTDIVMEGTGDFDEFQGLALLPPAPSQTANAPAPTR